MSLACLPSWSGKKKKTNVVKILISRELSVEMPGRLIDLHLGVSEVLIWLVSDVWFGFSDYFLHVCLENNVESIACIKKSRNRSGFPLTFRSELDPWLQRYSTTYRTCNINLFHPFSFTAYCSWSLYQVWLKWELFWLSAEVRKIPLRGPRWRRPITCRTWWCKSTLIQLNSVPSIVNRLRLYIIMYYYTFIPRILPIFHNFWHHDALFFLPYHMGHMIDLKAGHMMFHSTMIVTRANGLQSTP